MIESGVDLEAVAPANVRTPVVVSMVYIAIPPEVAT